MGNNSSSGSSSAIKNKQAAELEVKCFPNCLEINMCPLKLLRTGHRRLMWARKRRVTVSGRCICTRPRLRRCNHIIKSINAEPEVRSSLVTLTMTRRIRVMIVVTAVTGDIAY